MPMPCKLSMMSSWVHHSHVDSKLPCGSPKRHAAVATKQSHRKQPQCALCNNEYADFIHLPALKRSNASPIEAPIAAMSNFLLICLLFQSSQQSALVSVVRSAVARRDEPPQQSAVNTKQVMGCKGLSATHGRCRLRHTHI